MDKLQQDINLLNIIHEVSVAGFSMKFTVNVEAGGVSDFPSSIFSCARIFSSILHHHVADIDVRYNIAVDRHVLTDNEPSNIDKKILF